jgi:hypothetical protein
VSRTSIPPSAYIPLKSAQYHRYLIFQWQAPRSRVPRLVRFSSPTSYPRSRCVLIDLSNRYIVRPYHRASSLHAYELPTFSALPNATGGFASDQTFLRNILSGGTLSDRLSALTLMVQGVPLHNIRALEALNDLTEKGQGGVSASQDRKEGKGKATVREDGFKAARAIMDWWVGGGAPNRKLRCVLSTYVLSMYSLSDDVDISTTNCCYTQM